MKIVFTGGGTGGHFYPIIAVAEEVTALAKEKKLLDPELLYMANVPYNENALFSKGIRFVATPAGKIRRYFSLLNVTDAFKTAWGVCLTLVKLFQIYPDVVFGKGGYVSFPTLFAARFLRIPVIIHESDSQPGRVNAWAATFAKRIAISYPQSAEFFPADKTALTGNPIRQEIREPLSNGAYEYFGFQPDIPTILILGGSQGAVTINEHLMDVLPALVEKYQIIHQTGKANLEAVQRTAEVVLGDSRYKSRYKAYDYLNDLTLRMSAGIAKLAISRAGSTIFELAAWGTPSIIIPINETVSHDQVRNAFNYARAGGCIVIEEGNLSPHLLQTEINRLFASPDLLQKMAVDAKKFSRLDAARLIAEEILNIALQHEK